LDTLRIPDPSRMEGIRAGETRLGGGKKGLWGAHIQGSGEPIPSSKGIHSLHSGGAGLGRRSTPGAIYHTGTQWYSMVYSSPGTLLVPGYTGPLSGPQHTARSARGTGPSRAKP